MPPLANTLVSLTSLAIYIACIVLCIRIGLKKNFPLLLCILACFFHIFGLIIILAVPARNQRQSQHRSSGYTPPSGQPNSVRKIQSASGLKSHEKSPLDDKFLK